MSVVSLLNRALQCFFALVSVFLLAAHGQTLDIKVSTTLVTVPVSVTRGGKPFLDLRKADFELEQDGKPVQISGFEVVKASQEIPLSLKEHETTVLKPTPATSPRAQYNSLGVIAIDLLNTSFFSQKQGTLAILDALSQSMPKDQPVALVTMTRKGIHIITDFSTDTKLIEETASSLRLEMQGKRSVADVVGNIPDSDSENGPKINVTELPEGTAGKTLLKTILTQMVREAYFEQKVAKLEQAENARITIRSFRTLAAALGPLPGRKSLLWMSSSIPFPQDYRRYPTREIGDSYTTMLKELNDASVSVYAIHLQGLEVSSPESDVSVSKYTRATGTNFEAWYDRPKSLVETARDVSQATGGLAFVNANNFAKALRQALSDGNSYYMLTYYLKTDDTKPGWHELKVRLKEKGVTVRARSGFYFSTKPTEQQAVALKPQ
jgi:VWFA-related protein